MEPFLSFGEQVTIVPWGGKLKKGHCYAFITGSKLTIHRFIAMTGKKQALFAGDNCLFLDIVAISDVIGEYSSCQSRGFLIIINLINCLFFVFMMRSGKTLRFHKTRRRIIRFIIRFARERRLK